MASFEISQKTSAGTTYYSWILRDQDGTIRALDPDLHATRNAAILSLEQVKTVAVGATIVDVPSVLVGNVRLTAGNVSAFGSDVLSIASPTVRSQPAPLLGLVQATIPGAPKITLVDPGEASVEVHFTSPLDDGGAIVTTFTVVAGGAPTISGTKSPITVRGLKNGQTYHFQVFATNRMGDGAASASKPATPQAQKAPSAKARLKSIELTPKNPSVAKGANQQFKAEGVYSSGPNKDVTGKVNWKSSKTSKATINQAGLVTAVAVGSTNITATLGGIDGVTVMNVAAASLRLIEVRPKDPSIQPGDNVQFAARGHFSDGTEKDITRNVSWNSSDKDKATIHPQAGQATGVTDGSVTITATTAGITGSTAMTVAAPQLLSIDVTPKNASIPKGSTQRFRAQGHYSNGTEKDVTGDVWWKSSASVATIDQAGFSNAMAVGSATITATIDLINGSTVMTVDVAELKSIELTPKDPNIPKGSTQQFKAEGLYSDANKKNISSEVTWASSSASEATINQAGLANAVAVGSATITATSGQVSGLTVMKVDEAELKSIDVTPKKPSVAKGLTQQFKAEGLYSDANKKNISSEVAWKSSPASKATIDQAGLANAVAVGSATITATIDLINGSTVMTVDVAELKSIELTPKDPNIPKGSTQQFKAEGLYSDANKKNISSEVTWASSSASEATINQAGLANAVAVGSATITATSGQVSGLTVMKVDEAELKSIDVTPKKPSVAKGLTQQFKAEGLYSDANKKNISSEVAWKSSPASKATIDQAGLANAVAVGSATITATSGQVSGLTFMKVDEAELKSIDVTPKKPSVHVGATLKFEAGGHFSDASTRDISSRVTWSSSNTSLATISRTGEATALAQGVATIKAVFEGVIDDVETLTIQGLPTGSGPQQSGSQQSKSAS